MFQRASALGIVFSLGLLATHTLPTTVPSNMSARIRRPADIQPVSRLEFLGATPANAQAGETPDPEAFTRSFYFRPAASGITQGTWPSPDETDHPPIGALPATAAPEPGPVGESRIPEARPVASGQDGLEEAGAEAVESEAAPPSPNREVTDRSKAATTGVPARVKWSGERSGLATYYHPSLAGWLMANGEPYNPLAMTAASNLWPLGARLRVTYAESIIVEVTDRGKFTHALDLSAGAFRALAGSLSPGVIQVTIEERDGQEAGASE